MNIIRSEEEKNIHVQINGMREEEVEDGRKKN